MGLPLKLSPGVTRQGVSWAASLSRSPWVPGQGLTCCTGHWLSKGVSNPSPVSLDDFIFCRLLFGPFPSHLPTLHWLNGSAHKNKAQINAIFTLSNLIAELSLRTTLHVTHVARDKRSMCST